MARQLSKKADAHQDAVWALCFLGDNDDVSTATLASGSVDGSLRLWDLSLPSSLLQDTGGQGEVVFKAKGQAVAGGKSTTIPSQPFLPIFDSMD